MPIKRAFKLKNRIVLDDKYLGKMTVIGQIGDVYIVPDRDTLAIQLITHTEKGKSYIVLIPSDPSFVILKVDKESAMRILEALKSLRSRFQLNKDAVKEIEIITDLYLSLEKISKEWSQNEVKKVINNILPGLSQISDEEILATLIPHIAEGLLNVILKRIFSTRFFSEKVRNFFTESELKEIFEQELYAEEIKKYILRILKNNLLKK